MHWRLHKGLNPCFKVSLLRYAEKSYPQYQITVKLLGSFRLAAGRRHLHRPCIFTGQILETVPNSLYHSCASELHLSLIVISARILHSPVISNGIRLYLLLSFDRAGVLAIPKNRSDAQNKFCHQVVTGSI